MTSLVSLASHPPINLIYDLLISVTSTRDKGAKSPAYPKYPTGKPSKYQTRKAALFCTCACKYAMICGHGHGHCHPTWKQDVRHVTRPYFEQGHNYVMHYIHDTQIYVLDSNS